MLEVQSQGTMQSQDGGGLCEKELFRRLSEICDRNRDALLEVVTLIVASQPEQVPADDRSEEVRVTSAAIRAKSFITAGEAATLFGCSAQHLRNLVERAIDGKATEPIPFRDLDGVIVFPVEELMEWSRKPKQSMKRSTRKNKTHLKAIAS
jgi:hypothetical protein